MRSRFKILAAPAALAAGMLAAGMLTAAPAGAKDIVIGLLCDRTGPTAAIGNAACTGSHDYVRLVNSRGGVEGNQIELMEIDMQYAVPAAVEAYQRMKASNAVIIGMYGTPIVQALTADANNDRIPGTTPGFGTAAAADGQAFPYVFPAAASYWSQAAAAVEFAKEKLGGDMSGKKIAYLFYDNPAGREGLPVLQKLAEMEGFELGTFPVPPPGVEMATQIRDIARRFRADFVISHLFGRSPSVSIREFRLAGYPLDQVVSFVWGSGEDDIAAAGGWEEAEGYYGIQFAGVGDDYPVREEIRQMYAAEGRPAADVMASTVFYNRGLLWAALHLEAVRLAIIANGGDPNITGEMVRDGLRQITDFSLDGLVPPLEFTPDDHEGGGWVQIFQATKDGFVPVTEWFQGYRDTVLDLVYAETR